jgi:hypothetical protein
MKVRSDLVDISNTVKHLILLGKYFWENNLEWGRLWYGEGRAGTSLEKIYQTADRKFVEAVESIYKSGRATARSLSELLPEINNIRDCPRLRNYIIKVRSCQDWLKPDEEELSRCEQIIFHKKAFDVDYIAIEQMIDLHKEQLERLKDLDIELEAIRTSQRYKIEKGNSKTDPVFMSIPQLKEHFSLSEKKIPPVKKRLERFRARYAQNPDAFIESQNRGKNKPKYFYNLDMVKPIIQMAIKEKSPSKVTQRKK